MDEGRSLTVGVLGLGTHGTNHAEILRGLGHEVVGADADPAARRAFEREFDAPADEAPAELFARELDAAVISTPNKFHEAAAVEAFDAGLDVLLEKPLAHTVESAERIAAAAEEHGRICMVGFHHRFRRVVGVLVHYAETGYFGELTHVEAKYLRRRGIPGRGTWYTSRELAGGGALMDVGALALYQLLEFCGWPEIETVAAGARSNFGPREDYSYLHMWGEDGEARMYDVEDGVTAFCEFDDGTTASIEASWAANARSVHAYRLQGTEAGAFLDVTDTLHAVEPEVSRRNHLELFEVRAGGDDHFVDSTVHARENDSYRTEIEAFLDAVVAGERPDRCNVRRALAVQRAVDRIYEATEC